MFLSYGITCPVLEFLLLAGVPAGYILQVTGYPADLGDIMGAALRADCLAAQGTVFDARHDLVGAMAVVKRAHDLEVRLTAAGTGALLNNEVAGVALVFAFLFRNLVYTLVFLCQLPLFCGPIHSITWHRSLINF
jgi:hypothetical protein